MLEAGFVLSDFVWPYCKEIFKLVAQHRNGTVMVAGDIYLTA